VDDNDDDGEVEEVEEEVEEEDEDHKMIRVMKMRTSLFYPILTACII